MFCKMTTSSLTETLWILCVFVCLAVGGKNVHVLQIFASKLKRDIIDSYEHMFYS